MIGALRGRLQHKTGGNAVVEVAGVGYEVTLTAPDFASLPPVGEEVTLHTFLHVREDVLQLFAFQSAETKNLFIQLVSVTSVGPRLAMAILSHLSPNQVSEAIAAEDVELLATVPGVGKKSAGRLVLELKEKVAPVGGSVMGALRTPALQAVREALVGLGYTVDEAAAAVKDVPGDLPVEEGVKAALKRLAKS